MGKTAFIFPGQGSQYKGMGQDFYDSFTESKEIFTIASDVLGMDMKKLCFEEEEKLNITEYTQAAMITVIGAILAKIKGMNLMPDICAGLSLGEYAALLTAEVVCFEDVISLVRKRGIFMQEACKEGGGMSAVLGLATEKIEEICEQEEGIVTIANYNCPGQIVISGEKDAVHSAGEKMTEAGAKRVIPLKVSGPFHSSMLSVAGERLAKELEMVTIHEPKVPYVANVNNSIVTKKEPIKELLVHQVASSVRWQQSVETMIEYGVTNFIEIGPGKTLSSFVKKINRGVSVVSIDKIADLSKLL